MLDRNFRYIWNFLLYSGIFIYLFHNSRGTLKCVLRNPYGSSKLCLQNTALRRNTKVSAVVPEEQPDGSKDVGRAWLADRNFKILYCCGLKMHVNLLKSTGYFTY
jgi:hypothetical protein